MNKDRYLMLKAISQEIGESKDCTVKCLALTTGISYRDAHKLCKKFGREDNEGFHLYDPFTLESDCYKSLGYKLRIIPNWVKFGKTIRTWSRNYKSHLEEFLKKQENPIIIDSTGHVTAFLNSEVCDWAEYKCKRVLMVIEVIKI